jgi:predicted nucleic acid-binding protein
MAHYYGDSSILVKRHVNEIGATWIKGLTDPAAGNLIITARISIVEVYSAFNRRVREIQLDAAAYRQISADFAARCATQYQIVNLTRQVVEQARLLLERHPLRAYDAVQLASGLIANATFQTVGQGPVVFLSADDQLLLAAQAYNLAVDNPNLHP